FMALRSQRPPAGLIHHSDRGSQYCAYDYRVIQEQFGLKTSMSRKGNCYDNAPMESFWGTLKNESLSHYRFNNRDEAISVIREYIEIFYNRQRRHSRLGNPWLTRRTQSHQQVKPPKLPKKKPDPDKKD
ncbi:TPA: integrase core domain-containing protein, partial [Escherichia coli]